MYEGSTAVSPPGKKISVYAVQSGGWMYEVRIDERPVVVGWCRTREAAEKAAHLA